MSDHVVQLNRVVETIPLDKTLRAVLTDNITGVDTHRSDAMQPTNVIVHFVDAPNGLAATADSIVNAHGSLVVTTDKTSISANGTDTATITCNDAAISGDSAVDYTVWLDDRIYSATQAGAVTTGEIQLTLATSLKGRYLIEIKRQGGGNYESGYVKVEAT